MKLLGLLLLVLCNVALCVAGTTDSPVAGFNVVWDSPSKDHHGTMPLGNGDIAVNAWITEQGELQFYIAKTDAWDDNARLVKVGKVRLHFEPNPIVLGRPFKQELDLEEGAIVIEAGAEDRTVIRLWVDANHPVIHVTTEGRSELEATAVVELWRTNRYEITDLQASDIIRKKPSGENELRLVVEPDTVITHETGLIGWFHHNVKSVGPEFMAEMQGLTGFKQQDPLLHRTFGAVMTARNAERLDPLRLRSPRGREHRFSIYVVTRHPAAPEEWRAAMDQTIREVEAQGFSERESAHRVWWKQFWDRSWIRASMAPGVQQAPASIVPVNTHSVRVGMDQEGANRLGSIVGRLTVFDRPLSEKEITALSDLDHGGKVEAKEDVLFAETDLQAGSLADSAGWNFGAGFTIECRVRPDRLGPGGARLVDKITPGGRDGFLLDTYPGNSLRLICGRMQLQLKDAMPPGQWTHVAAVADPMTRGCRLYVNGRLAASDEGVAVRDEAAYVSRMYALQRFITACAGRGAYPIKFNGTMFTVPPGPTEKDPDYRRWGPGYWWQNTRLPYISLCTSGDFDLQQPLFEMYARQLLPLCTYRTKLYLGHEGAFYPECMMFWGAVFTDTYGWTPFAERKDKLQEGGWHKWEWVGGLELCWMMLDYYEHTLDRRFLEETAVPFAREILTFFDQHYPTNDNGKLVMYPSQALETWWRCTNATPELAGCIAVTKRLLGLPADVGPATDRELWKRLQSKLPAVPLREAGGKTALAPAEFFADKRNIENPELYPVFPFRLFAFNRPNSDWALAALEHRWDRGHSGWRQDDIFMAYLGLADEARNAVVSRASNHDRSERFPAFWGPNYDWTPDQDHGGVLMKAFQSMLLQSDGRQIFLLPAWPKEWDVEFKLHAPLQTVVEGVFRQGRIQSLHVTPEWRRADVVIVP